MNHECSTPLEVLKGLSSGQSIYIHGMAAAPTPLIEALAERAKELVGLKVYQLHLEGPAPHIDPALKGRLEVHAFFVGANIRNAVADGRAQYVPIFLSDIPAIFRSGQIPLDATLIHCSPPDSHGFCSLGCSVEATVAAISQSKSVYALVNPKMPRVHGDGIIHIDQITAFCRHEMDLPDLRPEPLDHVSSSIGEKVASLIEDGSTLQMGIGSVPNAVLACLESHKNLGIHSEMFSDGILPLVEKGIVNGSEKKVHPGKIVGTFAMGTQKLYDFINDNPSTLLLDAQYVNDTAVIRRNPKVVAINSAIEIDLTGQVCADSIGSKIYSGVGGQMDFMRGAALSVGGKAVLAMPSRTSSGKSKIVRTLTHGAGVVTTRAHVQYIVTEYGIAQLHGKSLKERARMLIDLAHPDDREALERGE